MMKKKLIIIGNTKDCDIGKALLGSSIYDIVGGIIDSRENPEVQQGHRNFLKEHGIKEMSFDEMLEAKPDAAIILTYSRVIPPKYVNAIKILNIHGGLLPKYRGLNASSWAIINNEKEVGYTLHLIDEDLDSGPIYHKFAVEIEEDEKFGDARNKIRNLICKEIRDIVEKILLNQIEPQSQEGCDYIYTMPFRKSDGKIDWQTETQYIYNLYRVFGFPYGTGIYFTYKDKTYEATRISRVTNICNYVGICGAVVNKKGNSIWVKTKDTLISVDEVRCDNEVFRPSEIFKIGNRLL